MKELSLHITDIVQNSIVAGASLVTVEIIEDTKENILKISIGDNGKGMSEELVKRVIDPFTTSRTTRKVGLGIPLFKLAAENTGGSLTIDSELGKGTTITVVFTHNHIDRQPLGDMVGTMLATVVSHEDIDFEYRHTFNGKEFCFNTKEIKQVLGNISFSEPDVYMWIRECLEEGERDILN